MDNQNHQVDNKQDGIKDNDTRTGRNNMNSMNSWAYFKLNGIRRLGIDKNGNNYVVTPEGVINAGDVNGQ